MAEHLPFRDRAFDAALAIFTIHHWSDWRAGLAEVQRVAGRVVILTWDPAIQDHFWLTEEYLPESLTDEQFVDVTFPELDDALGGIRVEPVPVPADCQDGFFAAYWARPEAYLDPTVRAGISVLLAAGPDAGRSPHRPARRRPRSRPTRPALGRDVGYRLVISDWPARPGRHESTSATAW